MSWHQTTSCVWLWKQTALLFRAGVFFLSGIASAASPREPYELKFRVHVLGPRTYMFLQRHILSLMGVTTGKEVGPCLPGRCTVPVIPASAERQTSNPPLVLLVCTPVGLVSMLEHFPVAYMQVFWPADQENRAKHCSGPP